MQQLKDDVRRLTVAVFGDHDHPKVKPGIVQELMTVERKINDTNDILRQIQGDIRKVAWGIAAAVGVALFSLLIKS